MGAAVKFRHSDIAKQEGEQARLKVVHGPDQGVVFVITGNHVTVGRGEDNEIVLSDLRASRKHFEIVSWSGPGTWAVQRSGQRQRDRMRTKQRLAATRPRLRSKDTIGLGETVLEFVALEAGTAVLQAPPTSPEQIRKEQLGLAVQKAKIQAMSAFGGLAKNVPRVAKDLKAVGGTRVLQQFQTLGKPAGAGNAKAGFDARKLLIPAWRSAWSLVFVLDSERATATSRLRARRTPRPARKRRRTRRTRDLASYLPADPAGTQKSPAGRKAHPAEHVL